MASSHSTDASTWLPSSRAVVLTEALSDPDDRKRAWARVLAETDRMGRLVDELLTLARLDQQPELRFRNVDRLSWPM